MLLMIKGLRLIAELPLLHLSLEPPLKISNLENIGAQFGVMLYWKVISVRPHSSPLRFSMIYLAETL